LQIMAPVLRSQTHPERTKGENLVAKRTKQVHYAFLNGNRGCSDSAWTVAR